MNNILVLIHDDPGQESRLRVALDIARGLGAHLTCLHETIIPEFVGDYHLQGSPLLVAGEERREALNGPRMHARIVREGVPHRWIDVTGFAAQAIEQHLRLVDLVVLSRGFPGRAPDMLHLADDLLSHGGKPLLLVPPSSFGLALGTRAVVAWDGSAQCEASLVAAIPLLRCAKAVDLVHVDDGSLEVPAEEAARYLEREGVAASATTLPVGGGSIATALIDTAGKRGAGYIVAGAYHRGVTWEKLCGGVTRELIREAPWPLFLAR